MIEKKKNECKHSFQGKNKLSGDRSANSRSRSNKRMKSIDKKRRKMTSLLENVHVSA